MDFDAGQLLEVPINHSKTHLALGISLAGPDINSANLLGLQLSTREQMMDNDDVSLATNFPPLKQSPFKETGDSTQAEIHNCDSWRLGHTEVECQWRHENRAANYGKYRNQCTRQEIEFLEVHWDITRKPQLHRVSKPLYNPMSNERKPDSAPTAFTDNSDVADHQPVDEIPNRNYCEDESNP